MNKKNVVKLIIAILSILLLLFIFNEIKIIKHWDSDIGLAKIKVEDGLK